MKFHWKVLIWMLAGVLFGIGLQSTLDVVPYAGGSWRPAEGGGLELVSESGPATGGKLSQFAAGDVFAAAVTDRKAYMAAGPDASDGERSRIPLTGVDELDRAVAALGPGQLLWLERPSDELGAAPDLVSIRLALEPSSALAKWIAPFDFIADIFLRLLKMLIVPLVFASIVSGVAGVGTLGDLRRLGGKTFGYYVGTSLLAILVGQLLVNVIQPGKGVELGLAMAEPGQQQLSFVDILRRMVPDNVPSALTDNGAMLQIIFFALILGVFITRAGAPHDERLRGIFDSLFEVMLRMAEGVLKLLPYGVFALLVRVVAKTGLEVFEPLLIYMLTVVLALAIHCGITLPLLLRFVGGISPRRWLKVMSPALMTAFSTSSSSMTLPVSLETVEKRGKVSNRITSFTLPLGATINMDGTALYECIGVVFLAQYYASAGDFSLTLADQGLVVMLALMASIGAAGIPSAGLVMMLTILAALNLPVEGAALLLAVDRPLDMLRTMTNVWSDSCGAAIIARSEGEVGPSTA